MAIERFYIIKDGERDGPFDESYVRFLLENDEIGFEDFCETEEGERIRLGTMYETVEEEGEEEEETAGSDEGSEEVEPPTGGRDPGVFSTTGVRRF